MSIYFDTAFSPFYEYQDKNTTKQNVSNETDTPLFSFANIADNYFEPFRFVPKDIEIESSPRVVVEVPKVGNVSNPFEIKTQSLLYKTPHKTRLLNIAQEHLGIQEVTPKEYERLSHKERQNTQMHLMEGYGRVGHQWCAHTVSHIAEESGMNIDGHKNYVQSFIDWGRGKGMYNEINTNKADKQNYKIERINREEQIKQQFKNIKEGDFIIWKSSYVAELPDNELIEKQSSHIGIIESVNPDGTITVIEGNANEFETGKNERYLVKTLKESVIGAQDIGDFKEVNRRDGVIRKTYTVKELAAFGYSGYIDTQSIIK